MIKISDLELNVEKQVHDITAEPLVRERLLELGLAPGRSVMALRHLPFFGPIVVQAGSLVLALRYEEAQQVWVK